EVIDADSWNLLAFTVTYEDARPLINGASIPGQPVAGPVGEIEFHAPPGVYVLDADVGSLLAVEEQTVDFGLGASADETSGVRLRPELGAEGRELAQQQVDELVERCLENHDQGDDTCPNRPPANADPAPDSVEWTLLKQPTVQWSRADGDHIGGIIEYDDFFSATWTEDGEPKSRDTIGWGSSSVEARVSREDERSVEITDLGRRVRGRARAGTGHPGLTLAARSEIRRTLALGPAGRPLSLRDDWSPRPAPLSRCPCLSFSRGSGGSTDVNDGRSSEFFAVPEGARGRALRHRLSPCRRQGTLGHLEGGAP